MNPWVLWPAAVLLAATGGAGVISGCVVHWWLELRALRPAYLAEQKRNRTDTAGVTLPG